MAEQFDLRSFRKDLIDELDKRYKSKDDCTTEMTAARAADSAILIAMGKLEERVRNNNWLTAAVAAGIIALVIKIFLGG